MTGLLRDTMNERADAAGYPHLDLDAIIDNGDRRVRRRRIAAGGATVAAAAAVVAAVALGPGALDLRGDGAQPIGPTTGQFAEDRPAYAVGSQIHYGSEVLGIGPYQIRSFVQTDDGFVATTSRDEVLFTDGATTLTIGSTESEGSQLAADSSGSYVGWVDSSAGPAPEFVVYDTAAREEVVRTAQGSRADPRAQQRLATASVMIAIDGGVAYWHDGSGIQAYDIAAGTVTTVEDGADASWLFDVESGQYARRSFDDISVTVGADPQADGPNFQGSRGYLTPDAARVATLGGDQSLVFDVATGDDVTPPHPAYPYVVFNQWLDDDRLTFLGMTDPTSPGMTFDLLVCTVTGQACDVAATGIAGPGRVVIQPGMPIG
jgi:hypothetical protein